MRTATETIPKWYEKALAERQAAGIEVVGSPDAEIDIESLRACRAAVHGDL